jgi:hypothetical protein
MNSSTPDAQYEATRHVLHRVATHVLARAQHSATGRIGLRVSPGGFATVEFGRGERLRAVDGMLVHEFSDDGSWRIESRAISGASLAELCRFAGVDPHEEFSAGHDTPPVGDLEHPIEIHLPSAERLGSWYAIAARALDRAISDVAVTARPSLIQLWPEHFDVATDVAFDAAAPSERRVNLGGSPGDSAHPAPYLYVGPWTADRPGDPTFWNASFGAILDYETAVTTADPVSSATDFFRLGLTTLSG